MPESYFIDCECGARIRVELFDVGTRKACSSCNQPVKVPSSNKLKELSGDKYPFLRPIEKVQRTAQSREDPFTGLCHGCNEATATWSTPCTLNAMVERHVADEGGIRPTITGGVKLVAAASEEIWQATTFPLLLCEQCQSRFSRDRSIGRVTAVVKFIALLGLLAAFLYFAYNNAELVAALSGIIWLVGAIAWVARFRGTKKLNPWIANWLSPIRWVPEAIAGEDEFKLTIGKSSAIDAR